MDMIRHKAWRRTLDFERQRIETFVSTLAHELRQPLSALLAAVEVVRMLDVGSSSQSPPRRNRYGPTPIHNASSKCSRTCFATP
jgi:signal transduction histidine kinase